MWFKSHSGGGSWGVFPTEGALVPKSEGRSCIGEKVGGNSRCKGPGARDVWGEASVLAGR